MLTYPGPDGTPLHYDERYEGDPDRHAAPVVALAGGAARHPDYLGDLAGLSRHRRLVLPHLRGVGRSPLPEDIELASYWRQAADVEALRGHLGLDRLVLLGHSAGTRLAVSYAVQFPRRVAALVLVAPPAAYLVDEPSDVEAMLARRREDVEFAAVADIWAAGPTAADGADLDEAAFHAWLLRTGPMGYGTWGEAERVHAASVELDPAANRAFFSVDPPPDLAARLGSVPAPVLVVAGTEDCLVGLAPVLAVAKLFPAATTAVLDTGHHPWVERPAEFRRAVEGFLNGLPGSDRAA